MVLGERVFQGAALLLIENHCQVVQHSRALSDLTKSMGELAKLRAMVRRQLEMILSLTDWVMRLERWRRNLRRGLGSSLGRSLGESIYGSAWSGSGTRESPIVECWVVVNFLEPMSSEEEREVQVAENIRLVPVCPPTPGLSCPSLAECLGVNFNLWRNNDRTSDGAKSGSDGRAGVSEEVKQVIWGTPPVIRFGSVPALLEYVQPPPYIRQRWSSSHVTP